MIHVITNNPLFKTTLLQALSDFSVEAVSQLSDKAEATVVMLSQDQIDILLQNPPLNPIILIGGHHKYAQTELGSPCSLLELKETLRHIIYHLNKAPDYENTTFLFSGRFRQITHKKTNEIIKLTEKENALIVFLVQQQGKAVSKDTLLTDVWNYHHEVESHTIETHIYKLRQKLGSDAILFIQNTDDGYTLVP